MYVLKCLVCKESGIQSFQILNFFKCLALSTKYIDPVPGVDPGFPIGGHQPSLEGVPTSDTGTFW